MVLADPEVLRAMEHSALEAPHYLPIRVKKDGSISDGIASAEQLGKLGRYVEDLLHQIAREIGSGNIDADPVARGPQERACDRAILLRPVPSRRAGAAIGCAISEL